MVKESQHIMGALMAAKVVSFINLKGGVGKSTLSMMVAEYLYFRFGKKVLVNPVCKFHQANNLASWSGELPCS